MTTYGTSAKCAEHPEYKLHLVCEHPACNNALICVRCDKCQTHAGHKTTDITDYIQRQRLTLNSRVADLTKKQAAAKDSLDALFWELLSPEDRKQELLLQTRVAHFEMGEDVSRNNVVCEEEVERIFLLQELRRGEKVCALQTFVVDVGHKIAECEAVCELEADQALRVVTDAQACVQSIDSMEANVDRFLVHVPSPTFSLKLPVSNVHDALTKRSALFIPVYVTLSGEGMFGDPKAQTFELSVDDKVSTLRREVASAMGLRENGFRLTCRGEEIAGTEDVATLYGQEVVTEANKNPFASANPFGTGFLAQTGFERVQPRWVN